MSRKSAPVPLDQCGMARAADLIADRTLLLVLRELMYGVERFDDIQAELACSRSVLSDRLKRGVDLGLVAKRAYQETGQRKRYAYVLTPEAAELGVVFAALMDWGGAHLEKPPAGLVHRETGRRLRAALVDEDGTVVSARDARIVLPDNGSTDADSDP